MRRTESATKPVWRDMTGTRTFGVLLFVLMSSAMNVQPATARPVPAKANDCDRACLNGIVDQYLAAIVAHDPSKVPHSDNVKYTENDVELQLGDGLWATASGIGSYKVYMADPTAGQVGFFGIVEEDGHPGILGTRIKVVNGKATEIETLVARPDNANSGFPNPAGLKDKPIFSEDVPENQRTSRAKMIELADGYFSTIQQNTGKIYTSFDDDCQRVENGVVTANNPNGSGVAKMGCEAQLKTGLLRFVTRCRDRRFPVVDEQKGLVLVSTFFDHSGSLTTFKLVDGTDYHVRPPFDRPFSFVMLELFKIKQAKIRQIEAVIVTVPYHMPSPWVKNPK
jgi:hypothetical protein